jgi:hypothetical protein
MKEPAKAKTLVTRTTLVNPDAGTKMIVRLKKAKAVDLRNNHEVVVHSSGYVDVVPINPKKRFH